MVDNANDLFHIHQHKANIGPDYMSRSGPVSRDLSTPVKHNDYITTEPARLAGISVSRSRHPRLKIFHAFTGPAGPFFQKSQ